MIRPGAWRTKVVARGEERRVRPAVPERNAEPLRIADDNVGAHLARRREQRQREQVGRYGDQHPRRAPAMIGAKVLDLAASSGYWSRTPNARSTSAICPRSPTSSSMPSGSARPSQDLERLRKAARRDQEHRSPPRRRLLRLQPVQQRHRLRRGGRLVEQRRVRHFHPVRSAPSSGS